MKNIVTDLDGNVIDELALRNEEIKENLAEILEEFRAEQNANRALKRNEKLGYRFSKQLFLELAKYPLMTVEQFSSIDYDILYDYWLKYLQLTAYYNRYFEIVDSKQLFQAFCGINGRQYLQLEKSEDEDIRNLMNSINNAILGLSFSAIDNGNADAKGIGLRVRASGEAGHSVVTAAEEKVIEQGMGMTDDELTKKLLKRGITVVDENRRLK